MGIQRKNVKSQKHKIEEIKGSYKFLYIKFNFSFLSNSKQYNFDNSKMTQNIKADILDRIIELSENTIISLGTLGKERGFETIEESNIKITAKYSNKFDDNEERVQTCSDKYYVFRIYPNNNPYPARMIGKWARGLFYIFFIDLEHKYV